MKEPAGESVSPGERPPLPAPYPVAGEPPGGTGMWVFLTADSMGFAALLAAEVALRAHAAVAFPAARAGTMARAASSQQPAVVFAITVVLVASGATMFLAARAAGRGQARPAWLWLVVTIGLGVVFLAGQLVELRGLSATARSSAEGGGDPAAQLLVVLTSYHAVHVLAGVGLLALLAARSGARTAAGTGTRPGTRAQALAVASRYWQFNAVIWLVLSALGGAGRR